MKIRIGFGMGSTQLTPDDLATVARGVADAGLDSLWLSEVLTNPGPDPLVALAWAAGVAPRLKVGTTMLLPGRNELRLAKSLATLDVLTNGRLLITMVPGLAHGAERDAIGVPVRERGAAIERTLPKLQRWWAGEEVDGVTLAPLPIQQPLEVWLGGLNEKSLKRCGRVADGWLGASCTPAEAGHAREVIQTAATEADREVDPEHFGLSISYSHQPLDDRQLATIALRIGDRDVDPRELVPVGYEELAKLIQRHLDEGLSKFVVRPLRSPVSPRTWPDELAELAATVGVLQN